YRASVDAYREVLAEPVPQPLRGAMLLSMAGGLYHGLGDWHAAQAWAARAARLYLRAHDDHAGALSRSLRAMALIEIDAETFPGSLTKAETLLRTAARTHAARGEHREQALALNNLGITLYLSGRYEDARRA